MKIAFIADIHSNLPALENVLQNINKQNVDTVYCLGDIVGYGPHPNECIELLKKNHIPTVMGNYDDGIGNYRLICGCDYKNEEAQRIGEASIIWTKQNTTEENKNYLKLLPNKISFDILNHKFLLVHGSPNRLNEYLNQSVEDSYIDSLLEGEDCNILVCGHTHVPFYKQTKKGMLINVGSVGKPKHGNPNATYVIANVSEKEINVEIIEVPYDVEKAISALKNSTLPQELIEVIATGKA